MGLSDVLKDILGLRRGTNRDFSEQNTLPDDGRRVPRDIEEELMAEFGRWNDMKSFQIDHKDGFGEQEQIFEDLEHILGRFFKGHHLEESMPWWSSDGFKENIGEEGRSLKEKMLKDPDDKPGLLVPHPGTSDEGMDGFGQFSLPFSLFERFFRIPFGRPGMGNERPQNFEDRDLDKEFNSGKSSLDDILPRGDDDHQRNPSRDLLVPNSPGIPFQNFTFRSYSQITKRGPDGVVEHQQSIKDADGNEEVIISRTIGDQRHTYRKRLDKDGNEEIHEDMVDLPEGSHSLLQPGRGDHESIFSELFGKPEGFTFEWKWP